MTSIFSRIISAFFGGSSEKPQAAAAAEPEVYNGLTIYAEPIREGNQFRLGGRIVKQVGDDMLERKFIRADVFSSMDDALDCSFRKARQIVDQNGASLFSDGEKSRLV
ncbi:HlyU family transcriptional regulator [Agrobacterium sp. ES01]|uniref:HlyU family transcriptional regulator n=1 Tax=Agrobacterium sp. ES01 TaxID=3420714 RepID=UPI003D0A6212